ncbi:SCO family protein [Thiomonas sp.]|jgi:protein SCO1/2|uniref:SCO family protein n=1 Tax=Thiomonas sp. TaxID=2047785 RepID=UPI00262DD57C|nr:SCO family protein [Thiomonas sp.]
MTSWKGRLLRAALAGLAALLLLGACGKKLHWDLDDVGSVLPDLQFNLVNDQGQPVTAADYAGKVVVLYFGYTHCPDVCPLTMSHLADAVQALGAKADDVRILFVSVDPARDTQAILKAYTRAFSPQAVGLTGSMAQIQAVTKRFHVAFNYDQKDASGNYVVNHSAAIYVFDKRGHGKLIGSETSPPAQITHDLRQLIDD